LEAPVSISDSESEGATSCGGTPSQPARLLPLKRPASQEGEVDCITLDSDSEEEQVPYLPNSLLFTL